jgi:glyoxylase-like metal-dependent hydrolase (beta-lactamase superfamily II)
MGARNWDDFEISSPQHVAGNIYNVVGGIIVNMAFSAGDDGIILVDSNFAALTEKILASIREISDEPIRFVIDTHDHADHADGNVNFGRAGAVILAHDSVRARLANPPQGPSAPSVALPIVTFAESMSLHVNGEEVEAIHVAAGHTDGDVLIFFRGSDVIHMGDVFVGQYPIIDVTRGGSYAGLIETLDRAIALIGPDTRVIPGHGPIGDRGDMIDYRNMLRDIYARVSALVTAGQSVEEIIASNPSSDFDQRWAGGRGSEGIVRAAYRELSAQ